jgi:hypothetical protein
MLVSVPRRTDTHAQGTTVKFLRLNARECQVSSNAGRKHGWLGLGQRVVAGRSRLMNVLIEIARAPEHDYPDQQ